MAIRVGRSEKQREREREKERKRERDPENTDIDRQTEERTDSQLREWPEAMGGFHPVFQSFHFPSD